MHLEDKLAVRPEAREAAGKKLLLLGDSIMLGYAPFLQNGLADTLAVVYPKENCRNTAYLLTDVNRIVAELAKDATLVQLNCGHWDAAHFGGDALPLTGLDEYGKNLGLLIDRLRRLLPRAQVLLATTTPMHPDGVTGGNPRTTEEIKAYNTVLRSVAKEKGVPVVDLFARVLGYPATYFADYCHLTPVGNAHLAAYLADWYQSHLGEG